MLIYIPFIYFTLWLILHLVNPNNRFGAGAMALLWVDLSAFFAILIDFRNLYGQFGCNSHAISFIGIILYCALWTIILYPLIRLDNNNIQISSITIKPKLFRFLCVFLILCMIIHIGQLDLATLKNQLLMDSSEAYSDKFERAMYAGGAKQYWMWVPNIVASFTPLYPLFWFISITICKQPKWISILLLLFSLLSMIVGFSDGGRAALLWGIMTFLMYFFLFKHKLSSIQLKNITILFACITCIALIGFTLITISRFDDGANNAIDSFIGYAGQPINNFCAFLPYTDFAHLYPERIFPLYQYAVKHEALRLSDIYAVLSNIYPIQVNVFFTLFGELLMDTGVLGLIIFLVLYTWVTRTFLKGHSTLNIQHLFIIGIILCIPVRGLFAWPFTTYSDTLYLFFSLCLYLIFQYNITYGNKQLI